MYANQRKNLIEISYNQLAWAALQGAIQKSDGCHGKSIFSSDKFNGPKFMREQIEAFEFQKNPLEKHYPEYPFMGHSTIPIIAPSVGFFRRALSAYHQALSLGELPKVYFSQLTGNHPFIEDESEPAFQVGCECGKVFVYNVLLDLPKSDLVCDKCGRLLLHYYEGAKQGAVVSRIRDQMIGGYYSFVQELGLFEESFHVLMKSNGFLLDTVLEIVDGVIGKALTDPQLDEVSRQKYLLLLQNSKPTSNIRYLDLIINPRS